MNIPFFARLAAKRALRGAGKRRRPGGVLDVRYGFALMRDRSVPVRHKLLAFVLAGIVMALLVSMEAPVELLLAWLALPFDMAFDGLEAIVGTAALAALILPYLCGQTTLIAD